jgi:hypothetical protein
METVDLTFSGEIDGLLNAIEEKKLLINYTVEGATGNTTTTSLLLTNEWDAPIFMVTFNYQELKELIEGGKNE